MLARRLLTILCLLPLAGGVARAAEPAEVTEPVPAEIQPSTAAVPATTAFAALVRATAAYEYGDMVQVVEAVRPVAEGTLPSNTSQRARALRFLGIGLFLTNRALGAENAFSELLRIDPNARLDPTTTRPEVVAFFETIRHQHLKRELSSRVFIWNLLPPAGQFQNGHKAKAWIIAAAELAGVVGYLTTGLLLRSWYHPKTHEYDHSDHVPALRIVQYSSFGLLGASYVYGVIDGVVNYYKTPDEAAGSLSWSIFPAGGTLRLTF